MSVLALTRSRAEQYWRRFIDAMDAPPAENFVYDVFQRPRTLLNSPDVAILEQGRPFVVGQCPANPAWSTCQEPVDLNAWQDHL
jgi:hypothetical protein